MRVKAAHAFQCGTGCQARLPAERHTLDMLVVYSGRCPITALLLTVKL